TSAQAGEPSAVSEIPLMQDVDNAMDHIAPEELADRLANGDTTLILVDVRPANEFASFKIKGAVNVPLTDLHEYLMPYKNSNTIVLYSNGMTHPAQARDSLYRSGFNNVYILTDGINGFIDTCLKPASLRKAPLSQQDALRVNQWRQYFLGLNSNSPTIEPGKQFSETMHSSGLIETDWLAENLKKSGIVVIDLRPQPEYNTSHIPGSLCLNIESLRGNVGGIGSMLLPADLLVRHFSLMGIKTSDTVILIHGDKIHDATLVAMALERLGHKNYYVLNGGFSKWTSEEKLTNTDLPVVAESVYPLNNQADYFTISYNDVLKSLNKKDAIIIDVRPVEYYTGQKSDEARAGHIPGALNRPFTEDIVKNEKYISLKSIDELEKAYSTIIPSKQSKVIIHCRTGHQASQTFFVLKKLLGYENIYWYDAGWSEWAARSLLPVEITE
ncbi:MAG TPA: rhodanese-like domain-containing protein, partial [Sedimentisphaerales bacterium]|nr:rhodanese-like domain-containing protein [Sedimentisphaerales bacterium]